MSHPWSPTRLLMPALAFAVSMTACDTASETGPDPQFSFNGWERTSFDVYTQNLYLGGDTGPLLDPTVIGNPVRLVEEVGNFWNDVTQSDVAARMDQIAEELAIRNPEVMGVQEALQFVTLGPTFQPDGGGFIDLLGALQTAIATRGLPYEVAIVQPTTASALPLEIDFSTGQVTRYLGFTDRVAIFKRTDVDVTDSESATYTAAIPAAPGVEIKRGWARVTVDHEGMTHHFVTTHLETQGVRPVHDAQAAELMAVLDALGGLTILTGDLNSDAAGMEGDPSWTPTYGSLIDDGFSDMWLLSPHASTDAGFTCCQDKDLRNEASSLEERIDFVLVRSSDGPITGDGTGADRFREDVVGDRATNRTADGLWPSDHAGLIASIRHTTSTVAED